MLQNFDYFYRFVEGWFKLGYIEFIFLIFFKNGVIRLSYENSGFASLPSDKFYKIGEFKFSF